MFSSQTVNWTVKRSQKRAPNVLQKGFKMLQKRFKSAPKGLQKDFYLSAWEAGL